jgi:DNA-binding beta-propeller fold protein YncE
MLTPTNIPNLSSPTDAVLDANGNVWVADSSGYLFHLDGTSGAVLNQIVGRNNGCSVCGPAFDYYSVAMEPGPSGNVWATSYNNGYVSAYSPAGAQQAGSPYFAIYGGWGSFSAAIDATGSLWLPGFHGMESLSATGTQNSGSPFTILGTKHDTLVTLGEGTAIDGAGHAWMTTDLDTVYELDSQGNILSGLNGFVGNDPNTSPDAVVIDGSGDVWYNAQPGLGDATLYELVGAAAPVVTPIAYGVQTNQLGKRP